MGGFVAHIVWCDSLIGVATWLFDVWDVTQCQYDMTHSDVWLQCATLCCSVSQCVAVCCNLLQCVAVCCSVSQYVAVCCSVLQCAAVHCSALQCVAACCSALQFVVHIAIVPVRDMAHAYAWHDSWKCVTWLIHTTKQCVSNRGIPIQYGVATVSRIDKIVGLFCRISSLL